VDALWLRLRRHWLVLSLPTLQLVLFGLLLQAESRRDTLATLALLLASGLWGWLRSLRRLRAVADTPTARIASAAQGYAELRGRGEPFGGQPLLSPLNQLPVLWYRLVTERRDSEGRWRHERSEESDASFLLVDASGECTVDPEGAEMLVQRREVSVSGELRLTQWSLLRHDPIYVLGDFHTQGSAEAGFDEAARMRELLEDWKADRQSLLARFDLDRDGQIDLREWELARAQARRQARRERDAALALPPQHQVRAPADGRHYLISDLDPGRIVRRYRLWAGFHLTVFLGAAAALAWYGQAHGLPR
jgi:hypothetical protein